MNKLARAAHVQCGNERLQPAFIVVAKEDRLTLQAAWFTAEVVNIGPVAIRVASVVAASAAMVWRITGTATV